MSQENTNNTKKVTTKKRPSRVRKADPFYAREAEKYDNPLPSREYIEQILTSSGTPMNLDDLASCLEIADFEREPFARRLGAMERAGQLMRNRKGDYILPDKADLIRGRVEGHPDGYGFLVPDDGTPDLFLGPKSMREVLHGDRALVRAVGVDNRGRREARIVEVLARANTRIVGRVVVEQGVAFVAPENRRINQDILLTPGGRTKPKSGEVVTVEITQQPAAYTQPIGRIVETLGTYADPGMEIEIALRKHDLPFEFSAEVKAEAKKLPSTVRKKDMADREDIRHLRLVTIDGETARDFDDAVYCERQGKGYRLLVAIADVSHYVQPGSALDSDGLSRGNSVYFPRRVIPMLPEKLSNGLCSLNPEVDRLCMVCDMEIGATGAIKQYRFYPAVMYSHARLTYTKVAAALYDQDPQTREELSSLLPQLENLDDLFRVLLKARGKRGAIDFDTVETRMVFNEEGKIERIVPERRNDAHRLIEECMLAANVCASDFLQKHKHPALYRVHEGPTAEKLEKLRAFLAEFGLSLGGGESPRAGDFAKVVEQIKGRPDALLIQTVMLRSLQQAVYSPENVGHFGLAYEAYTHFTSPIRRYPDLLVHRAIKAVLSRQKYEPVAGPVELLKDTRRKKGQAAAEPRVERQVAKQSVSTQMWEDIGMHCSMTERRADEASRDVESWLKCYYMQDRVGEEYSGSITSVVPFGLFVTLDELFVEGLVHVSELGQDYFHYDESRHEMHGERTNQRFRLADRLTVQIVGVNLESRKIDFRLVGAPVSDTRREGKTARDAQKHAPSRAPKHGEKHAAKQESARSESSVKPRKPVTAVSRAAEASSAPRAASKNRRPPPAAVPEDDVVGWRDLAGLPPTSSPLHAVKTLAEKVTAHGKKAIPPGSGKKAKATLGSTRQKTAAPGKPAKAKSAGLPSGPKAAKSATKAATNKTSTAKKGSRRG